MSLSIIYSTRTPNPEFSAHLRATCGLTEVEILSYLNPGQRSLSAVYNQGLTEAKYPIIVLVHDDVIFETTDWGQLLIQYFQHTDFGIFGVAGTTELPTSGQWWQNPLMTVGRVKHQTGDQVWTKYYSGVFPQNIIPVVSVDGVFIAVNKNKSSIEFNEQLTGFHFYDIDYSINNHLAGVKLGVLFEIKLRHQSIGPLTSAWERARLQFLAYHQYNLPCTIPGKVIVDHTIPTLSRYPKITVIILNHGDHCADRQLNLLLNCVNSFAEKCHYPNYNLMVVDTGSSVEQLAEIETLINHTNLPLTLVKLTEYHFSRTHNRVVSQYTNEVTELLLFCSPGIELINDALSQLIAVYLQHQSTCGILGGRLHAADNKIQQAGVAVQINHQQLQFTLMGQGSYYQFMPGPTTAPIGGTAPFLLIARSLFVTLDGFNEDYLESLADIELNLNSLLQHHTNYWVGDAVCYHLLDHPQPLAEDGRRLQNFLAEGGLTQLSPPFSEPLE